MFSMSICHVLWGRKTSSSLQYETEGLSKSAAGIKSNQKWRIILFAMERNGSVTVHMRFTEDKHSGGNNNI